MPAARALATPAVTAAPAPPALAAVRPQVASRKSPIVAVGRYIMVQHGAVGCEKGAL